MSKGCVRPMVMFILNCKKWKWSGQKTFQLSRTCQDHETPSAFAAYSQRSSCWRSPGHDLSVVWASDNALYAEKPPPHNYVTCHTSDWLRIFFLKKNFFSHLLIFLFILPLKPLKGLNIKKLGGSRKPRPQHEKRGHKNSAEQNAGLSSRKTEKTNKQTN